MTQPATNLPATSPPKPQVMAGGPVAALVPRSLDEAFRVAQAIAASGLAPASLSRPEQVMVAIMAGAELGLAPFQALQSFAVINGKPTLWGDGLMAVARAQGVQVKEWMEGEGDQRVAWCEVTRPDSGEVILRKFSVDDAKRAGLWGKAGPWTQYPQRMMPMRARAWALRDGCADMLRGFQVREEVEDHEPAREVGPRRTGMRERLTARAVEDSDQQGFDAAYVDATISAEPPVTAEVEPPPCADPDDFPGDRPLSPPEAAPASNGGAAGAGTLTLAQRADAFLVRVKEATGSLKLKSIGAAAADLRKELDAKDPELLADVDAAFHARMVALEDAEAEERRGQ